MVDTCVRCGSQIGVVAVKSYYTCDNCGEWLCKECHTELKRGIIEFKVECPACGERHTGPRK